MGYTSVLAREAFFFSFGLDRRGKQGKTSEDFVPWLMVIRKTVEKLNLYFCELFCESALLAAAIIRMRHASV